MISFVYDLPVCLCW